MKAQPLNRFELLLKNEKVKSYDRITLFIILINLAVFILLALQSAEQKIRITSITGSLLIVTLLVIHFIVKNTKTRSTSLYSFISVLSAAITWMIIGKWWAALLCFALSVLYQVSRKPLQVLVNPDKINYTSFPVRAIQWNELNNVILKDGILTIDFRNNKIVQAEIDDVSNTINEKEFNDFCSQQLKDKSKS